MKIEKNEQILEAAQLEFLNKGFDGASMEHIATIAEVSKRTLYKYYPTKEVLFDKIIEELFENIELQLNYPYSKNESLQNLFDQILSIKFKLLLDDTLIRLAKIILSEQIKKKDMDKKLLERLNSSHQPFKEWLKLCVMDRRIKANLSIDELSDYFNALVEGLILFPLLFGFKDKFSKRDLEKKRKIIYTGFLSIIGYDY